MKTVHLFVQLTGSWFQSVWCTKTLPYMEYDKFLELKLRLCVT